MKAATLADICSEIADCAHKTAPLDESGEYFAVGTPAMRGNIIDLREARRISKKTFEDWTVRLRPRYGDLLLAREAPVGPVVRIPPSENVAPGQRTVLLRPDSSLVDSRFLYYYLISPGCQERLIAKASGSTVPHLNVADVRTLPVPGIPPIPEQQAISAALGALDDKIAANDRLLDQLAELQDTEFTRVSLQSTSSVRLDAIATVSKGVSYRRSDLSESTTALVTLKAVGRRGKFARTGFKPYSGEYRELQVVQRGDIIVAQTDLTQNAEIIGWAVRVPEVENFERLVASLDLAIVRPTHTISREYLLGALRQPSFRSHCQARMSGTTVLHLGPGAIQSFSVPVVTASLIAEYSAHAAVRFDLSDAISKNNSCLRQVRDELLPLLMSGRIRVRDAEKVVEEAV